MNIIISEDLHHKLQKHVTHTIEFGSGLKGNSDENSDKDLLHIVESADWWVSSPIANQHLLQFKEDNCDHIYCNAHTFVKSILDGDTTIFIEMHRFGALKETNLSFLENYNLTYYRTLRAYLGISKRDLKDIKKLWKTKNYRKMDKKFKFVKEGIDFVIKTLHSELVENAFFKENDRSLLDHLFYEEHYEDKKEIVFETEYMTYEDLDAHVLSLLSYVDEFRTMINTLVEKKLLRKTIKEHEFISLMASLGDVPVHTNMMIDCRDEVMKHFYNSYYYGI